MNKIIENPTKEEHGFEVTKMSILNLQVCPKLAQNEIELNVNRYFHSGTSNGWSLETMENLAPVDCDKKDGSKHYVFTC